MARIVICEFMDEIAIRERLGGHDVLYDPGLVDAPATLIEAVSGAEALIVRNRTQVRGALLEAARALKAVGRLGVGLDNIDVEACAARGIRVFPATGANDVSVAEYVVATAMLLLRGVYGSTPDLVAGAWPRVALSGGREISGKRLGLVGFGAIARETARRAAALGMNVAAHAPRMTAGGPIPIDGGAATVTPLPLDALLASSDVVSLHVPLTAATRGMIGARELGLMRTDAVLINSARGGVVDESALVAALRDGRLGGAALDVFEAEPLRGPQAALFEGIPNLVLTPHVAGLTAESNLRVSRVTAEAVARCLEAG
jgi:(S)-sulfolactate dehydrogenase